MIDVEGIDAGLETANEERKVVMGKLATGDQ